MSFECFRDKNSIVSVILLDGNTRRGGKTLKRFLSYNCLSSSEGQLEVDWEANTGMILKNCSSRILLIWLFFPKGGESGTLFCNYRLVSTDTIARIIMVTRAMKCSGSGQLVDPSFMARRVILAKMQAWHFGRSHLCVLARLVWITTGWDRQVGSEVSALSNAGWGWMHELLKMLHTDMPQTEVPD